nr:MAG TPA: hypothetical protein [Caudoviricetes sp.]
MGGNDITVSELIDVLIEHCNPDDTVYADYSGCIYKVVEVRTDSGEVILDVV